LPKSRVKRRLVAILAADVVGYSHQISVDETDALARLAVLRSNILEPAIDKHFGRLFKTMGDGFLAEFSSAVQAVTCAIDIQTKNERTFSGDQDASTMRLRIGIHVGDVIVEDDDLMGDGVNIAARLESIAETGGVSISHTVYDQIRDRVKAEFVDKGEIKLKNIPRPVQVFAISSLEKPAPIITNIIANLGHTERPSIAVLPFENMSGDSSQEYFVDGITEDILTDLSKISELLVIDRHSSFGYRGKAMLPQKVSADLSVNYLVKGSVRKSGNRVRVTAQLIDGSNGGHIWAERYDRELTDIFAVQDEITGNIVRSLKIAIAPVEQKAIARVPTDSPEAYDFYLRGRNFQHEMTKKNLERARQMFQRAVEVDSEYTLALAGIADCNSTLYMHYSSDISVIQEALTISRKALDLDPSLSEAHASMGLALSLSGDYESSAKEFNRAVALNPMLYEAYWYFGLMRSTQGNLTEASGLFTKASQVRGDDLQSVMMQMTVFSGLELETELLSAARKAFEIADRRLQLNSEDARAAYIGATALVYLNETSKALDWGKLAAELDSSDPRTHYNLACLYSSLGQSKIALDHLEQTIRGGRPIRFMDWAKMDPDLSSIRIDPRFGELMIMWQKLEKNKSKEVA
jgi:adenylate cyclase